MNEEHSKDDMHNTENNNQAESTSDSVNDSENNTVNPRNRENGQEKHQNDTATNNKDPNQRFAHKSQVASPQHKQHALELVCMGVVVILVLMIFSSHRNENRKQIENSAMADSPVLDDNTNTIHHLLDHRNQGDQPHQNNQALEFTGFDNTESKEMVERRNAPTQMYTPDTNNNQSDANSNTSSSSSALPGQGPYSQYMSSQQTQTDTVTGTKITHPDYTIAEGEFIHANLETAINSDLPGMVRAVIKDPVYAYTGEQPLIPAGSRLIGQYFSMSSNGSATTRLFIIWNRIITPQGISIMINSPGADSLGQAGMGADAIDSHFLKIFGTASLLSIMGASTATNGVSNYDQPNSANMFRQGIAQAFQQSGQAVLNQNLSIKPTLHIYQGDDVNVFVAHDVDLYDVLGPGA